MRTKESFAIDPKIFKLTGLYQMVDPNGSKMFGYNAYNSVHAAVVAVTWLYASVGLSGIFRRPRRDTAAVDGFRDTQSLFCFASLSAGNLKILSIIRHAETISRLFFGEPRAGDDHVKLADCARRLAKVFPWYIFLFAYSAFAWIASPVISNRGGPAADAPNAEHSRKTNVGNFRYPMAANTYDRFYNVLFAMESVLASYCVFGQVSFDLFLIALLRLTCVQYEIVASSYESLKCTFEDANDGTLNSRTFQKEFVAITLECQCIYERLKLTYKISRSIVFVCILGNTIGMVSLSYLIVTCYMQNGSSIYTSNILSLLWTLCVVGIQCYVYCSLYQRVNERKEAINFGLYSCDWTSLNVQKKKLILLAMRMNNSNRLNMNVTPTKGIDLPMFSSIVQSSYRVTSVMINSGSNK